MKKTIALLLISALAIVANAQLNYADFRDNGIYYKIARHPANPDIPEVRVCSDAVVFEYLINGDIDKIPGFYTGKQITIPEHVTYNGTSYKVSAIASFAFANCTDLNAVVLPSTVTEISEAAFYNCGEISVNISNVVSVLGSNAFKKTTLIGSVDFSGLRSVGNYGLVGFDGRNINLGKNLISFGSYALDGVVLDAIRFEDNTDILTQLSYMSHAFGNAKVVKIAFPFRKYLGLGYEFIYNCSELQQVIFPNQSSLVCMLEAQSIFPDLEGYLVKSRNLIAQCPSLKDVVCLSATPPQFNHYGSPVDVSIVDNPDACVLRVPKGSEDLYRADAVWGEFKNIQGFEPGEYAGIAAVDADNSSTAPKQTKVYADNNGIALSLDKGTVEIYNPQGVLVKQALHNGGIFTARLPKGFYIVSVK